MDFITLLKEFLPVIVELLPVIIACFKDDPKGLEVFMRWARQEKNQITLARLALSRVPDEDKAKQLSAAIDKWASSPTG